MFDQTLSLVIGGIIGYGIRACISHYRRAAAKRRLGIT